MNNSEDVSPLDEVTVVDGREYHTLNAMKAWLEQEKTWVKTAAEDRIRAATKFVEAFEKGEITIQEANARYDEHNDTWPGHWPAVQDIEVGSRDWKGQDYTSAAEKEEARRRFKESMER
jgi:hypothetical protein